MDLSSGRDFHCSQKPAPELGAARELVPSVAKGTEVENRHVSPKSVKVGPSG